MRLEFSELVGEVWFKTITICTDPLTAHLTGSGGGFDCDEIHHCTSLLEPAPSQEEKDEIRK